jgi:acyl-coenzyme A thioesterase PaaI-like protein
MEGPFDVNDLSKSAFLKRPDLHVGTEGEFRGWRTWSRDAYETNNGPFWHRMEDDGSIRCAFRVAKKHLNGGNAVHGGCFMSFADDCLFATAATILQGPGVTMSFACEFLAAAQEGELIEGRADVTRAGNSVLFMRGMLTSGERPVLSFSGTIKRVKRNIPTIIPE